MPLLPSLLCGCKIHNACPTGREICSSGGSRTDSLQSEPVRFARKKLQSCTVGRQQKDKKRVRGAGRASARAECYMHIIYVSNIEGFAASPVLTRGLEDFNFPAKKEKGVRFIALGSRDDWVVGGRGVRVGFWSERLGFLLPLLHPAQRAGTMGGQECVSRRKFNILHVTPWQLRPGLLA